MITALVVFQVVICVLLVTLVLLQFGKGAEVGAVMGGGASQAIFSSSQSGNILSKLTTACAILFMLNSVALTTLKSREAKKSIFDNVAPIAAPLNNDAAKAAEAATAATTATTATDPKAAATTTTANQTATTTTATKDAAAPTAPKK